jgi:hypothetical protein
MIVEPGEIEKALIHQLGGLHFFVFDDDRVVVLRERQRVDPAPVLSARWELSGDKATIEDRAKVVLD